MPLFMDVHQTLPEGVTADALFHAHEADLQTQGKYGVKYLHFWGDPEGGWRRGSGPPLSPGSPPASGSGGGTPGVPPPFPRTIRRSGLRAWP